MILWGGWYHAYIVPFVGSCGEKNTRDSDVSSPPGYTGGVRLQPTPMQAPQHTQLGPSLSFQLTSQAVN